jgi:hypothetical protein
MNEVTRQHLAKCLPGFSRFPVWNDPNGLLGLSGRGVGRCIRLLSGS